MADIQVKIGSYAEWGTAADELRRRVFLEEQGVPEEEVFDGFHETCLHAVLFEGEMPTATARLLQNGAIWQISWVATDRALRGRRLGEKIMLASMEYIVFHGGREIVLDAQSTAVKFYEKLGFTPCGEATVFESGFILVPMKYTCKKSP